MFKFSWVFIFATAFLLVYFHLYLSTDFRHILISTNKVNKELSLNGPRLIWQEILKGPIDQNQSDLLTYVRNNVLHPPSQLQYNLTTFQRDPSMGQAGLILRLLNNMQNGFFVECGALDGETRSNTLILEKEFGWQGLLTEGDSFNFHELTLKRRKAWSANVCLAIKPYPHRANFAHLGAQGRILSSNLLQSEDLKVNSSEIQCFPLFTLLATLNVTFVDYLSLDVEGNELDILKTIPLHFIPRIRAISIEYLHVPDGRATLHKWLSAHGFTRFGEVSHPNNLANDWIFVNRNVMDSMLRQRLETRRQEKEKGSYIKINRKYLIS